MPKAVFLDLASVDCDDLDLAGLQATPYQWTFHASTSPEQTLAHIGDADVVVSNKVVLSKAILEQSPSVKLICIAATGTNNVDIPTAKRLGITVCNVTGYATPAVVQHVFALILALTTRLPDYQRIVADGAWQQSSQFCLLDFPITEITGKRLGIVGYGELGQAVARVAQAFGMEVLVAQRPGSNEKANDDRIPMAKLLPQVDILTLHCPLSENSRNLIDAEALAQMKPNALLINTARGGIVDETALREALQQGKLGGAGTDVLIQEPPANGNPLLRDDIPNLIVTPHIAWASRESRQRLINEVTENIQAHLRGDKRNAVT
ncbi:MAG: 2-hydroxyacid dehydrogenase [Chromatiales bacterium]|nr:2-hydroxyacid dehydrogenase [Chromatiales bacterium]